MKHPLLAIACTFVVLAGVPAFSQSCGTTQHTFDPQCDDHTQSLGVFRIQVADQFAPLFASCPASVYNSATKTFTSPTLYDPTTLIGRSSATLEGNPEELSGVSVGVPPNGPVMVGDNILVAPTGFAAPTGGTREVHTEIHKLNMVNGGFKVRAGVCYNDATCAAASPGHLSPGEVISNSTSGDPTQDFPARSYFDVFVQVDVPACAGSFPGAILYNQAPLIVHTDPLNTFPPDVVYLHDNSSAVPILFKDAHSPQWNQNDVLGYLVLAGHGIGPTAGSNSPENQAHLTQIVFRQTPAPLPCKPCQNQKGGPTLTSFAVLAGLVALFTLFALLRRRRWSYSA